MLCRFPLTNTECLLITPLMHPFLKLVVHQLVGGFTQTESPMLYGPYTSSRLGGNVESTPFIQTLYASISLVGAVALDTLSSGITLYQYAASISVHCFLAMIIFTLQWQLFAMPFPDRMYAHCS